MFSNHSVITGWTNNRISFFFSQLTFHPSFPNAPPFETETFFTRNRKEQLTTLPIVQPHEFRTIPEQSSRRLIPRFRSLRSPFTVPVPRVAIHQSHAAAIQREIQAVVRTFAVFLGHLLPRRLNVSPPRFRPRSSVSLRFLAVLHPPTPRAPHRDPYGVASRFRARTFLRPFADLHPNLSGYLAADASRHVAEIEPRRSYATRTWKRRRGSMRREFARIQRRVRSLFVHSFQIKSYVA